ncbi:MAG: helix-turn-helix domain-containing protein [Eubacteriales bacterium]|nr:helix-turn-helix domain-containing protein [Eubacteriales bacterium]
MATCKDLLYHSQIHNLELLGGREGLERVITWPYSILTRPIRPWTNGGEFAFYYGAGMDNSEEGLCRLVEEAYDSNLSGLVIMVGDTYILDVPQSVIDTANRLKIPLFATDTASYITSMQQAIMDFITRQEQHKQEKADFWSSLFFDTETQDHRSLNNKAHYFGIDPSGNYCVYILRFLNLERYAELNQGVDELRFFNDFLDTVNRKTDYYIASSLPEVWTLPRKREFILVSPVSSRNSVQKTNEALCRIAGKLEASYPGAEFVIGKGLPFKNISNIRQSYIQARRSLSVLSQPDGKIADYADIGFYKLLFEVGSRSVLEEYIQDSIFFLEEKEKDLSVPLVETLETYLNCRGNVSKAASLLYLHRNTMILRLNKIESLLGIDLNDNAVFYDLQISMMIYHYLKDTTEET